MADFYVEAINGTGEFKPEMRHEDIVFSLINAGANAELLSAVPFRQFHDLAVIYRVVFNSGSSGICSSIVTYETAERMNWSEKDLFDAAWKNTRRMFPVSIMNLSEVCGMPPADENDEHYVITNIASWNGAAAVLYDDVLRTVAEKMDEDFYLLPSSCHEMLAVPSGSISAEACLEMVGSINMDRDIIDGEDVLSDNIYRYNCGTGVLDMISKN